MGVFSHDERILKWQRPIRQLTPSPSQCTTGPNNVLVIVLLSVVLKF